MLQDLFLATVGAIVGSVLGWIANGWQNRLVRQREFDREFRSRRQTLRILWLERDKLDRETFVRQFGTEIDGLADMMHRAGKNYALKVACLNRYRDVSVAFHRHTKGVASVGEVEAPLVTLLTMPPSDIAPLTTAANKVIQESPSRP